MPGAEVNFVHEATIWSNRLEEETKAAATWRSNWGFLANKPQPPPRGYSTNMCKYSFGGNQWTLHEKRVPDSSEEGRSAAVAELNARKNMSCLNWSSKTLQPTKPCEGKGAYTGMKLVDSDTSGVKTREAALLMRTHVFQSLGDACRTVGVDPADKYRCPITSSHEVGWRATTSAGNGRPGLEMFGVSDHGIKGSLAKGFGL